MDTQENNSSVEEIFDNMFQDPSSEPDYYLLESMSQPSYQYVDTVQETETDTHDKKMMIHDQEIQPPDRATGETLQQEPKQSTQVDPNQRPPDRATGETLQQQPKQSTQVDLNQSDPSCSLLSVVRKIEILINDYLKGRYGVNHPITKEISKKIKKSLKGSLSTQSFLIFSLYVKYSWKYSLIDLSGISQISEKCKKCSQKKCLKFKDVWDQIKNICKNKEDLGKIWSLVNGEENQVKRMDCYYDNLEDIIQKLKQKTKSQLFPLQKFVDVLCQGRFDGETVMTLVQDTKRGGSV